MKWGRWIFVLALAIAGAHSGRAEPGVSVEIDLEQQTAYLIRGRRIVLASPISSGRLGHFTETGAFKIIQKERNHFSSLYGKIVDARGRTVVADADADMKVPRGGKFIPAPMRYFMRFDGATGMHAGYLPGYPASHGCVRMPEQNAVVFFNAVEIGTPVHVFGRTPRTREYFRYGPQPARPLYQRPMQPRFDPRLQRPPIMPNREPDWD
jgi:lipoprotein-anchoring transpeptidase ErfK/SrfK